MLRMMTGVVSMRSLVNVRCYWLVFCLTVLLGSVGGVRADDLATWRVQIRPRNFHPDDPWAYTRLQGETTPGHRADGLYWNDPDLLHLNRDRSGFVKSPFTLPSVVQAASPQLTTHSPSPEVIPLGQSVQGLPLVLYVFGQTGQPVLIFGAIHGSEQNSGHLASSLFRHLVENPEDYRGQRVAILPVANPDGMVRASRTNLHQIDLNRNFPAANWGPSKAGATFGGERPGSEPETQAIIKAVDLLQPRCIVTIHAITKGRHCNNYDGPGAAWAQLMFRKNGYPVKASIGYPTPGSFGSWAGNDRQIPTITLELPHNLSGADAWEQHREALLAVIQTAVPENEPAPEK